MRYTVNVLTKTGFPCISRITAELSEEEEIYDAIDAIRAEYPGYPTCAYSTLDRSFGYFYEFEFGPRLHFPAWQAT